MAIENDRLLFVFTYGLYQTPELKFHLKCLMAQYGMEYKCNIQYWLENVLKKLYKKVQSLEKVKPRNRRRKKLNVPLKHTNMYKTPKLKNLQEREKSKQYQLVTHHRKQKNRQRKLLEKHMAIKQSNQLKDKFWKFVDAFLQSRSFLSRNKNAFFLPVISSDINYTLLKSIGNTLTLRSRVISRHISNKAVLPGDYGEEGNTLTLRSRAVSRHTCNKTVLPGDGEKEGFLHSAISANGGRKTLAQKLFSTIQRARIKRATDIIAKEVLGGRKAKKSSLKKNLSLCHCT